MEVPTTNRQVLAYLSKIVNFPTHSLRNFWVSKVREEISGLRLTAMHTRQIGLRYQCNRVANSLEHSLDEALEARNGTR